MTWIVQEGLTGILTLTAGAIQETYIPDYDQDKARELLLELQELKDVAGRPLKSNYHAEGFNWYPSMVSFLYWYLFFPAIKYAPLLGDWMEGRRSFVFKNEGQFRSLIGQFDSTSRRRSVGSRLHYLLMCWHNRFAARTPAELLFFRFADRDFRTEEIRKTLGQLGVTSLNVVPAPSIRRLITSLFKRHRDYFYSQPPTMARGNRFCIQYPLREVDEFKRRLFEAAISAVECSITSFIIEYRDHLKALRRSTAKTFYGLDDINGYVFPVLYATRTLGLHTVGHQHGAYVRRHAAYMMEGIEPAELQWFDQVIVWGEFWRAKMQRCSKAYVEGYFVVGSNKFSALPSATASPGRTPRNVLIPYEFLANTARVGEFIRKLIDLGYQVSFKPRPDDDLGEQLDSYCLLPRYRESLKIVPKLDAETIGEIDIVAGTMTTLIYELLPCSKIVWVLATEFRHLFDLVEEGLAHLVCLDDLCPPGQMPLAMLTRTCIPSETFFGATSLGDVLRDNVIGDRAPP